ncbi:MAG: tetratricopeptide (TPR) repeat protein [Phenylobacterium sp.]|jgi:tetratricopeptide (TPR) repeat protein
MIELSGQLPEQQIRTELGKVLSSKSFVKSQRLSDFLSFVVECALTGNTATLKGYTIGIEVYGRPPSFDPQTDTVVRVGALRLRKKLQAYYDTEGQDVSIQIKLPDRTYAPVFLLTENLPIEPLAQPVEQHPQQTPINPPVTGKTKWVVLSCLMLLVVVCFYGWFSSEQSANLLEKQLAQKSAALGADYRIKEDYANAIIHWQKSVVLTPGNSGYWRDLGDSQLALAQYKDALHSYVSALAQDRGEQAYPVGQAEDLRRLGRLHLRMAEFSAGLDYARRALALALANNQGFDDNSRAYYYNDLADIYLKMMDYPLVLKNNHQAFALVDETSVVFKPFLARLYLTRATLQKQQGHYLEAVPDYTKALALNIEHYGQLHSKVALAQGSLGSVYWAVGQLDQAQLHYHKALAVFKGVFGENHPKVATSYNNIANILVDQADYEAAQNYYLKALAINRLHFARNSAKDSLILYNLGEASYRANKPAIALDYLKQSLVYYLKTYGKRHQEVAIIWADMANAYALMGDPDLAMLFFDRALPVYQRVFGEKGQRTLLLKQQIRKAQNAVR